MKILDKELPFDAKNYSSENIKQTGSRNQKFCFSEFGVAPGEKKRKT